MDGGERMIIGKNVLAECGELLAEMLTAYGVQINDAFQATGEEPLSIGLNLKIRPGKGKEFDLEASISFVMSRVKDTFKKSVNEAQMDILTFVKK
jgi:hypothetical protein